VVELLPAAQPLPPRVVSNAAIRNQWRLTKEERDEQAQRKVLLWAFACDLTRQAQKRYADRAAERRVEPAEGVAQASSEVTTLHATSPVCLLRLLGLYPKGLAR
jgi:hypothetical protein